LPVGEFKGEVGVWRSSFAIISLNIGDGVEGSGLPLTYLPATSSRRISLIRNSGNTVFFLAQHNGFVFIFLVSREILCF